MKSNLEKIFKSVLKDYEAPYDPKAWDKMADALDKSQVSINNGLKKWLVIGLVAAAASIVILMVNTNSSENEKNSIANSQENKRGEVKENLLDSSPIITNENIHHEETDIEEKQQLSNEPKDITSNKDSKSEGKVSPVNCILPENKSGGAVTEEQMPTSENVNSNEDSWEFKSGQVSKSFVCAGEEVMISNPHQNAKVRVQIDGLTVELEPGKTLDLLVKNDTQFYFLDEENHILSEQEVQIYQTTDLLVKISDPFYEQGLPKIELSTTGDFKSISWFLDERIVAQNKTADINAFYKGNFDLKLVVKDHNGCNLEKDAQVIVNDDYNLMAVNAFKPSSFELKNKTFMPFALTERNVPFEMQIIDPIDHSLVYSTQNATEGWDGVDRKSGRVNVNKSYVWKVQLFEKEPEEKSVYMGTVTVQ